MKKSLILGAGRGPRLAVLELIKRSPSGMGVKQLAAELGMSYMGVKAHCLALTSAGYLTTWRQPAPKGRPLMFYKLAEAGEMLFQDSEEELALGLLQEVAGLFGAAAPLKILMKYFQTQSERYQNLLAEDLLKERVSAFVEISEREGRMSTLVSGDDYMEIRESHQPLASLMRSHPEARAMEENMVSQILGRSIHRREDGGAVIFSLLGKS
jgi:predicted ArsR family transcriptional regulator